MDFELDSAQHRWLAEIREFLRETVTDELLLERARYGSEQPGPATIEFRRLMGERGWFGLSWPKQYGGLEMGPVFQHIMLSELEYWRVPTLDLTVTSVAPMIMRHGTERNKIEFLPLIARGEMRVAVGYSEPDAGTDLASLRTSARLDGAEWVINGSKIWNSLAQTATHEWLCVRTDPHASKHKGISVVIVPIDQAGVDVRPLVTWPDLTTNETFFTDVRVPQTNLIGEVNRGWQYITGALDLERGALTNAGDLRRAVDELIDVAGCEVPQGHRPIDDDHVRRAIARLDADVEVAVLMGLEASSMLADGEIPTITVTVEKIFTSELRQRIADTATTLLGMGGVLSPDDSSAPAAGAFQKLYRAAPLMRFGAGTNEVLRDVIGQRGYAMPRRDR
ncbi:MAG: putative acyl-CoA dehydrogenase [Pseudonocardiales bacterium]|nr:putative acyl-CoA dehydrogenase [Pseudonocardiales bacterium]